LVPSLNAVLSKLATLTKLSDAYFKRGGGTVVGVRTAVVRLCVDGRWVGVAEEEMRGPTNARSPVDSKSSQAACRARSVGTDKKLKITHSNECINI
jgi:hypothetical protein